MKTVDVSHHTFVEPVRRILNVFDMKHFYFSESVPNSALNNSRVYSDTPSISPRVPPRPPPLPTQPIPPGTRVAAVAPLMSNKTSSLPVKRRPAPHSDVICLSDDEPGPSAAKRAANSPAGASPLTMKNKPVDSTNRCKICDAAMATPQIQSLHELHRNGMKWFCLDCASAQMDEVEAMKHYFSTHVKVAEQRAIEKVRVKLVYYRCVSLPCAVFCLMPRYRAYHAS
ncbi:hypothetical protein OSTOST_16745 [Ostertagia ostertagi]